MKLISINIERDRHYARWMPWVKAEQPDVVCLQELYEEDAPRLAAELGYAYRAFAPLTVHGVSPEGRAQVVMGQGIWSKAPLEKVHVIPYAGEGTGRDVFDTTTPESKVATSRYSLLSADVGGTRIVTTHFVWTPDGEVDDNQRSACTVMLEKLQGLGNVVLCGDFNAPRGKETFARLAEVYKDNIPPHYMNSIDKTLHRAGATIKDYMVDGLFTTPAYKATDVRLVGGVSDHMGVVGEITRI
ncbi:MAG: endonuclease/exonuclease/phosphatase family protein [Alphaproteobacteria bacterium]